MSNTANKHDPCWLCRQPPVVHGTNDPYRVISSGCMLNRSHPCSLIDLYQRPTVQSSCEHLLLSEDNSAFELQVCARPYNVIVALRSNDRTNAFVQNLGCRLIVYNPHVSTF